MAIPLHGHHGSVRSHLLGQEHGEEAGTRVEVNHVITRLGFHPPFTAWARTCRARVDLPEHAGRDPEGDVVHDVAGQPWFLVHLAVDHQTSRQLREPRSGAVLGIRGDQWAGAVGGHNGLQLGRLGPSGVKDADCLNPGMGDGAVVDRFNLMRPVAPEARQALLVDGQADPGPPGQSFFIAWDRFDFYGSLNPGHACELVGDPIGL